MLRERATPLPSHAPRNAWAGAPHSAHLSQLPDLKRFLICTVLYQAGIQAVITLARSMPARCFTSTRSGPSCWC